MIREEDVSWRPVVDLTRIILGAQLVALVALSVVRSVLKARAGWK